MIKALMLRSFLHIRKIQIIVGMFTYNFLYTRPLMNNILYMSLEKNLPSC